MNNSSNLSIRGTYHFFPPSEAAGPAAAGHQPTRQPTSRAAERAATQAARQRQAEEKRARALARQLAQNRPLQVAGRPAASPLRRISGFFANLTAPSGFRHYRDYAVPMTALLAALLLTGCGKAGGDADDKPKVAAAADQPGAADGAGVTLAAETQQRLGLATATPVATDWQPELKAYGTVLDRAPLRDLLLSLNQAMITFASAQRELERGKVLKAQNNLSERAFQDLETASLQSRAAVAAVRLKLQAGWGGKIADWAAPPGNPAGAQHQSDDRLPVLADGGALIRVDLPAGERLADLSGTVHIVPLAETVAPVEAANFDRLPTMDPQTQQQSLLCLVAATNASQLTPGEAVTAYLKIPGPPVSGVVVPASAVLRYQGADWVYVQTATNRFSREVITLDQPVNGGWFVSAGLAATDRLVVAGAQSVLSAELSGGGFSTGQRD